MVNAHIRLLAFGIDDNYEVYLLLGKDNKVPSAQVLGDVDLNQLVNSLFEHIFKYSALFSTPMLSDVRLVSHGELVMYYYTTVPHDTLNNIEYKWVKPYETISSQPSQEGGIQLSVPDYQAIHTALGRRQYTSNKPEGTI